jgi:hypothetical protein
VTKNLFLSRPSIGLSFVSQKGRLDGMLEELVSDLYTLQNVTSGTSETAEKLPVVAPQTVGIQPVPTEPYFGQWNGQVLCG